MRVLELCLSDGHGGLEMYPHKVLGHLRSQGIPSKAVVRRGTMLASRLEKDRIEREYLRARVPLFPVVAAQKLADWIDTWQADILHMHWRKDLNLAVLAKRFSRRPVRLVYTRQMALTRYKHDTYHRFLYRHVDRYVTITRRLKEEAERYLPMPAERIVQLYYGVAPPEPMPAGACSAFFEEHGLRKDAFTFAVFSRIHPVKGQHLAVEALDRLVRQGIDTQLVIVGHVVDEGYFARLKDDIETRGLAKCFRYAGFVDNPSALMECFDAVVLPSYGETFGLVVAEAMRAGTAVIGSDGGGVPEMIRDGETGLLFPEGNPGRLAAALARLEADPNLRGRLAREGKLFADAQFDEERHYAKLLEIFEACVAEPAAISA